MSLADHNDSFRIISRVCVDLVKRSTTPGAGIAIPATAIEKISLSSISDQVKSKRLVGEEHQHGRQGITHCRRTIE